MASSKTQKLQPKVLQADEDNFISLKAVVGYKPANNDYLVVAGQAKKDDKDAKQEAEILAYSAWQTARDNAVAAEWAFHDWVLGSRDQVKAQFGPDSNELQSVGLKKKSEYKSKASKAPKTP